MNRTIHSVDLPPVMTGEEVLCLLRIHDPKSPRGILHRLRRKGLPSVRAGRSYVYPTAAVMEFLHGRHVV